MSRIAGFMTEILFDTPRVFATTIQVPHFVGNLVDLVPSHNLSLLKSGAPIHVFQMLNKDSLVIGEATIILDPNLNNVEYVGNFGGSFTERAQDPEVMAEALTLLCPLAKKHGLAQILITTRVGDKVVEKACQLANAKPLDCITVPAALSKKKTILKRFVLDLA